MLVQAQKLQSLLDRRKLTRQDFADKLGVDITEVDKMLSGQAVGYNTAHKFIFYLKADRAQHLIDWKNLGIENPLAKNCDEDYEIEHETVKEEL